tara:strand:+ start:1995 stop:4361 length:2367 start_codon:yes stop_codon:yes gene_type:complete
MTVPRAAFTTAMDAAIAEPRRKIAAQTGGSSDVGLPLGGLGTGGISFSRTGRFSRWTLNPQQVLYHHEVAAGFAVWHHQAGHNPAACLLQPNPGDGSFATASWRDTQEKADHENIYSALFPKAWHDFGGCSGPVRLSCESFSPMLPDDIAASTLPVAVFNWHLSNTCDAAVSVALMFHFPNLIGAFHDKGRPYRRHAGCFNSLADSETARAIVFDRLRTGPNCDMGPDCDMGEGQMAISVAREPDLTITARASFDANSDGRDWWPDFSSTGTLQSSEDWIADAGFLETETNRPAGALAAKCELAPGEHRTISFALSWDLPVIRFGAGRRHARKYAEVWGTKGCSALALSEHALSHGKGWSRRIDDWHATLLAELGDDPAVSGMMLNELYFLVDGQTAFTAGTGAEADHSEGHFGLIECPDYPYYNTLDLWIYASEAVLRFWPEAARLVMQDYARSVPQHDSRLRRHMRSDSCFPLKRAGALPHDQGAPDEDPWYVNNGYAWQDSTQWKDLNAQFLIGLVRDAGFFGKDWLERHWEAARMACAHLNTFDRDGDGLIENDGFPDQTFDNIPMQGPGAYCGGLWIAALFAMAKAAGQLGDAAATRAYREQALAAREAFHTHLWTGTHYRLDRDGPFSDCLLIEQLFGAFLARRYGFGEVVADEHAILALKTLYRENFQKAGQGEGVITLANMSASAVQAVRDDSHIAFQTSETIVGFNFSFAAQLDAWGLTGQAGEIRKALYRNLYQRGMFARTPAAYDVSDMDSGLKFRASMNMRPLAVWYGAPWKPGRP